MLNDLLDSPHILNIFCLFYGSTKYQYNVLLYIYITRRKVMYPVYIPSCHALNSEFVSLNFKYLFVLLTNIIFKEYLFTELKVVNNKRRNGVDHFYFRTFYPLLTSERLKYVCLIMLSQLHSVKWEYNYEWKGNGSCLLHGTMTKFAWRTKKNHRKNQSG
jgi:hypothetical protein